MVNKVFLIGNLGGDPETKAFENNSVTRFSLATNETYTDRTGEKKTVTEWHNIVVWGKQGEIAQNYLKKGSKVFIEGKITNRKYTDKDNVERYTTEIVVNNFKMLDSREQTSGGSSSPAMDITDDADDLPF